MKKAILIVLLFAVAVLAQPQYIPKTDWDTAYTHSQDNTQAHSDYLLNNANDTTSGIITGKGFIASADDANMVIIDGTSRTPHLDLIRGTGAFASDSYGDWRIEDNGADLQFIYGVSSVETLRNYFENGANGDNYFGSSTYTGTTFFRGTSYPVIDIQRAVTDGTGFWTAFACTAKFTANALTTGGTCFTLAWQETDDTVHYLAQIGAKRDGDDNKGILYLQNRATSSTWADMAVADIDTGWDFQAHNLTTTGDIISTGAYGEDLNGATYRDLLVKDDGTFGYDSSTRKKKTNIRDYNDTSWIYDLRPRIYDRKTGTARDEVGLIAEEVAEVADLHNLVVFEDGPSSINYSKLIVPLLKEIQSLKKKNEELEQRIKRLETFHDNITRFAD